VCSRDADDGTEFIVLRRALVAYLRAQPPVKNVVPKSVYYIKLPRAYGRPIKQKVVAPPRTDKVKYGAYLAGPLGHCIACHTPSVSGSSAAGADEASRQKAVQTMKRFISIFLRVPVRNLSLQ